MSEDNSGGLQTYARPEDEQISIAFNQLNQVETVVVPDIIAAIPKMSNEQLDLGIAATYTLENAGFKIRGAMLAEKKSRAEKLAGGRGQRDEAGKGVTAVIAETAKELGVSKTQLEEDARIYEVFQDELKVTDSDGGEHGEPQDQLPRQFFAEALKAGAGEKDKNKAKKKQKAALKLIQEKRDELGTKYTAVQAKQDIQALKGGATPPQVQESFHVRATLDANGQERLRRLAVAWGGNDSDTVNEALKIAEEKIDTPLIHQIDGHTITGISDPDAVKIDSMTLKQFLAKKNGKGGTSNADAELAALKAKYIVEDPPETKASGAVARLSSYGKSILDAYLAENPGLSNPQIMDRALMLLAKAGGVEAS